MIVLTDAGDEPCSRHAWAPKPVALGKDLIPNCPRPRVYLSKISVITLESSADTSVDTSEGITGGSNEGDGEHPGDNSM
ncbi:hypothetical protein Tco_1305649 [Tanacetum coccineum]